MLKVINLTKKKTRQRKDFTLRTAFFRSNEINITR
jgi:hypothetical protein